MFDVWPADLINISHARNFDVVFCLGDVKTIVKSKKALAYRGNVEKVVNLVQNMVCDGFQRRWDSKVIDLLHEDGTFVKDHSRVDAWFMDHWGEPYTLEYFVDVLFP